MQNSFSPEVLESLVEIALVEAKFLHDYPLRPRAGESRNVVLKSLEDLDKLGGENVCSGTHDLTELDKAGTELEQPLLDELGGGSLGVLLWEALRAKGS